MCRRDVIRQVRPHVSGHHGNHASSSASDLEGAADAAIERKNDSEMGAVLSRCSASDRLLMDRLNRARASAARK